MDELTLAIAGLAILGILSFVYFIYETQCKYRIVEYKSKIEQLENDNDKLREEYEILSRCKNQQIGKMIKEAEGETK